MRIKLRHLLCWETWFHPGRKDAHVNSNSVCSTFCMQCGEFHRGILPWQYYPLYLSMCWQISQSKETKIILIFFFFLLKIYQMLINWKNRIIFFFYFFIHKNLLHMACKSGDLNVVKYLMDHSKIDIYSKDIFFSFFFLLMMFHFFLFFLWHLYFIYLTIWQYYIMLAGLVI